MHVLLKYPFSLRLLLIDIQSVVIPGGICLNFFKVAISCSFNYPAVIFFFLYMLYALYCLLHVNQEWGCYGRISNHVFAMLTEEYSEFDTIKARSEIFFKLWNCQRDVYVLAKEKPHNGKFLVVLSKYFTCTPYSACAYLFIYCRMECMSYITVFLTFESYLFI